jgi:hypothetical protein
MIGRSGGRPIGGGAAAVALEPAPVAPQHQAVECGFSVPEAIGSLRIF